MFCLLQTFIKLNRMPALTICFGILNGYLLVCSKCLHSAMCYCVVAVSDIHVFRTTVAGFKV